MSARRAKAAGVSAILIGVALIATVAGVLWNMHEDVESAMPEPSPNADFQAYPDGFPIVDWGYWEEVNPAVIGWVTIPGTNIDLPIVQGPKDDPDYYLSHDVYKNRNANGCPYLDAECAELGLLSRNSVIFAHHSSNGAMFSELANYSDAGFAAEHPRILLQTPDWKATLTPRMVSIVDASKEPKQVVFQDDAEYAEWWADKRARATLDLDSENVPARTYTFVTCSYTTWSNERTVVYAAPMESIFGFREVPIAVTGS